MCYYVHVTCAKPVCGGQRTTFSSWLSSPTWALDIELGSSRAVARAFESLLSLAVLHEMSTRACRLLPPEASFDPMFHTHSHAIAEALSFLGRCSAFCVRRTRAIAWTASTFKMESTYHRWPPREACWFPIVGTVKCAGWKRSTACKHGETRLSCQLLGS